VKGDAQGFGWGFVVLEALGKDSERERLDMGDGLGASLAVAHGARQGGNFSEPSAIVLPLDFDGKV
jgi:hypothetical protein